MYRLIGDCVVVQSLHDVYLSPVWPTFVLWQQPESRPGTSRSVQFGADFQTTVGEADLALRIDTTSELGCGVSRQGMVS